MYKEIFKWTAAVITQPSKAWKMLVAKERKEADLRDEEADDPFQTEYLYPFIGLLTIAAFLSLFTHKEFILEQALKSSIITCVSSFGGYYVAAYVLNEIGKSWFSFEKNLKLWQHFVGYSSALMFTLNIVWMLLPDVFFLYIFILYTFYIVWEGATIYFSVGDAQRMKFTTISTLLIIATPHIINKFLLLLMPGLRY